MSDLALDDVMKSVRDLPALPVIVIDLLSRLDQDDSDSALLADKISQDQALTAKTLRLANSSFYGMQRKIGTIQQAITVLGFDSVRTLITAAGIIGNFPSGVHSTFDFNIFWRHAIATALVAKSLAKQLQLNQDQAFLAGLLHDVGRLVLIVHSNEMYQNVMLHRGAHDCSVLEAEQAVIGLDHTMAGRALAEHWKFPPIMQKAIERHHHPDRQESQSMSALIQAADAISHALDLCGAQDDLVPAVGPEIWQALRIDQGILLETFDDVEKQFEEACQILAP